jgi:adenylate cyclase
LTQRIIDLADETPNKNTLFVESPVALAYTLRGGARACLGTAGWREDFRKAAAIAQNRNPLTRQAVTFYTYVFAVPFGVLLADHTALRETEQTVAMAERSADDATLFLARLARGVALVHHGGPGSEQGLEMIVSTRRTDRFLGFSALTGPIADVHIANERTRVGDFDGAVEAGRAAVAGLRSWGESIWCALATTALVGALLRRGRDGDLDAADTLIDRLAAVPTDPDFVLHDITLLRLRSMAARARGEDKRYRDIRDRYRNRAAELGFDGHIAWAAAMP